MIWWSTQTKSGIGENNLWKIEEQTLAELLPKDKLQWLQALIDINFTEKHIFKENYDRSYMPCNLLSNINFSSIIVIFIFQKSFENGEELVFGDFSISVFIHFLYQFNHILLGDERWFLWLIFRLLHVVDQIVKDIDHSWAV